MRSCANCDTTPCSCHAAVADPEPPPTAWTPDERVEAASRRLLAEIVAVTAPSPALAGAQATGNETCATCRHYEARGRVAVCTNGSTPGIYFPFQITATRWGCRLHESVK